MAKLLFLDEVYQMILPLPGMILEFGTWLGGSTVAFENLRAIHEPYNAQRRTVSFDTFSGYTQHTNNDAGPHFQKILEAGTYTAPDDYSKYLERLLEYHESENVMKHVSKHQVVTGDAALTLPIYLDQRPETLVALAYFDMALYEPTRSCLDSIQGYLIPGSIIVLDELGHPDYPGESIAYREVFKDRRHRIKRSRYLPDRAIVTILE